MLFITNRKEKLSSKHKKYLIHTVDIRLLAHTFFL
jgi:hypothetical protein